jgi:hypothetical protein
MSPGREFLLLYEIFDEDRHKYTWLMWAYAAHGMNDSERVPFFSHVLSVLSIQPQRPLDWIYNSPNNIGMHPICSYMKHITKLSQMIVVMMWYS